MLREPLMANQELDDDDSKVSLVKRKGSAPRWLGASLALNAVLALVDEAARRAMRRKASLKAELGGLIKFMGWREQHERGLIGQQRLREALVGLRVSAGGRGRGRGRGGDAVRIRAPVSPR